ncbi:MAG: hypothetical protein LBU15_03955 [Rickettsiales bacterium]|jgi:hypothetical protein|nr:hypothetical protein [Rickettsiales bacterium]
MALEDYDSVKKCVTGYTLLARCLQSLLIFFLLAALPSTLKNLLGRKMRTREQFGDTDRINVILKPALQISEKSVGFVYLTGDRARMDAVHRDLLWIENVKIVSDDFTATANLGYLNPEKNEITLLNRPALVIH